MDDLAARAPSALTSRIGALSPTMSSKLARPWAFFVRRPTSAVSCVICSAFETPTSSRSGLTGLTKKSCAPACMALTTASTPALAVSTMTGVDTPALRSSARHSMPDISGITMSSSTTSAPPPRVIRSMASPPPVAWTTA